MRNLSTIVIVILVLTAAVWGMNMEKFGSHRPDFFVHSLDVELHGDLALVTGYGGLMIYDISDNDVRYINRYLFGGGRGIPFYNCTANEDVAFVTGRDAGLFIVDIENPQQPGLIRRWTHGNSSVEDAVYQDDILAVTLHQDGMIFLNVSELDNPDEIAALDDFENAWTSRFIDDDHLVVADGDGGLAIVRYNDGEPEVIARHETTGSAIDLRIDGNLCAIAVGAAGVDLFNIEDPEEPVFISNFNTPTYAGHIGLDGDLVAVADWDRVMVYDISNREEPFLDGFKFTEVRAMGVDLRGSSVYLADWAPFIGYAHGEIEGPDIEFSTRRINPNGDALIDTSLFVYNYGNSELEIRDITCPAQQFEVDPREFSIDAGDSVELEITYLPDNQGNTQNMRIRSNDEDEASVNIALEGAGGLSEGDRAPDFTAPLLAGGNYRLSDMRDRVQLLIFWASW